MPDYGQIFLKENGSGEVWYVGGDGDARGFDKVVKKKLMSVQGIDEITYESEAFPPKDQGWMKVYPAKTTNAQQLVVPRGQPGNSGQFGSGGGGPAGPGGKPGADKPEPGQLMREAIRAQLAGESVIDDPNKEKSEEDEGEKKPTKNEDRLGGEDPKLSLKVLKAADFVTLPKGVPGTNCSNCRFQKGGVCQNEHLKGQPVNNRTCCCLWDAAGTLRAWKEGTMASNAAYRYVTSNAFDPEALTTGEKAEKILVNGAAFWKITSNAWSEEAREAAAASRAAAAKSREVPSVAAHTGLRTRELARQTSGWAQGGRDYATGEKTEPVHDKVAEAHDKLAEAHTKAGHVEAAQAHRDAAAAHRKAGSITGNATGQPRHGETGQYLPHGAGTGKGDVYKGAVQGGSHKNDSYAPPVGLKKAPSKLDEFEPASEEFHEDDAPAMLVGRQNNPDGRNLAAISDEDPDHLVESDEPDDHTKDAIAAERREMSGGLSKNQLRWISYNRAWPQSKRDKLQDGDFAGPHQSFPISSQEDVNSASKLIGHADNPEAVKRKIKRIARRKGLAVPKTWNCGGAGGTMGPCPTGGGGEGHKELAKSLHGTEHDKASHREVSKQLQGTGFKKSRTFSERGQQWTHYDHPSGERVTIRHPLDESSTHRVESLTESHKELNQGVVDHLKKQGASDKVIKDYLKASDKAHEAAAAERRGSTRNEWSEAAREAAAEARRASSAAHAEQDDPQEAHSNAAEAHFNAGNKLSSVGLHQQAEQHYEKAREHSRMAAGAGVGSMARNEWSDAAREAAAATRRAGRLSSKLDKKMQDLDDPDELPGLGDHDEAAILHRDAAAAHEKAAEEAKTAGPGVIAGRALTAEEHGAYLQGHHEKLAKMHYEAANRHEDDQDAAFGARAKSYKPTFNAGSLSQMEPASVDQGPPRQQMEEEPEEQEQAPPEAQGQQPAPEEQEKDPALTRKKGSLLRSLSRTGIQNDRHSSVSRKENSMTSQQREAALKKLTANCACREDREVFNELSDETVERLYRRLATNAKPASGNDDRMGDAATASAQDDEDDEFEQESDFSGGGAGNKGPKTPENPIDSKKNRLAGNRRELSYEEWMAAAPPRVTRAVRVAEKLENTRRMQVVNQLTAIAAGCSVDSRKSLIMNKLKFRGRDGDGLPLDQLEDLLILVKPVQNRDAFAGPIEVDAPSYLGQAGGGEMAVNAQSAEDREDVLELPKMHYTKMARNAKAASYNEDEDEGDDKEAM